MSYCLNPACKQPNNPPKAKVCESCGSKLFLHNRYRVVKKLGKGGFGETFLAVDLSLPGTPGCVIKQLRPSTNDPNVFQMARELFEREAKTLGKVGNHPQVPRLLDYFEENNQFYLVQEFVKGYNLQQEVKKSGPFNEAKIKHFLVEILPVIKYIHSQKVIHRDIKPANIIRREEDGKLVLIDFGAVKNQVNTLAAKNTSDQTALTAFAVGTVGFAPPEQLAMRPVYASDIYAIGVTCLYLLTGRSPKDMGCDPTTGELMWEEQVNISEGLAKVIRKMLEVSVRNRYKSADELTQVLDIVPYENSLAQGMTKMPSSNSNQGGDNNFPTSGFMNDDTGMPTSATAKLAMAIRNRRSRRGGVNPAQPNNSPSFNVNQDNNTQASNRSGFTNASKNSSESRKNIRIDAGSIIQSYNLGKRDFSQLNLNNINLAKANLAESNFNQASLIKAIFQEANISGSDLTKANLNLAMLRKANLTHACLNYADLQGADLRGADLRFAQLKNANLKGADLRGAKLTNANVSERQIEQAKTNWFTIMPNGKRKFW